MLITTGLLAAGLVPSLASALVWPAPFPREPQTCVYEGVFPGSGTQGTWRLAAGEPGHYTVTPDEPSRFGGIVARYVAGIDPGADALPFTVAEGVLSGVESGSGNVTSARETLDAVLVFPGDAHGHVTEIMDRRSTCGDLPADVNPGDEWTCSERIEWRWTGSGPQVQPVGAVKNTVTYHYRYVEDQDVTGPGGKPIRAALLSIDGENRNERQWLDPSAPWCPLVTERLKVGKVVGTDRLVAIERTASVHLPNRDAGNITLPRFAIMLLVGAFGVAALAFGISFIAGRRRSKRDLDKT